MYKGKRWGQVPSSSFSSAVSVYVFDAFIENRLVSGMPAIPTGLYVCLYSCAVMFGYHGTAVCFEIRYCDASDFFFFNYLGSLVLNIKFRILCEEYYWYFGRDCLESVNSIG